MGRGKLTLSKCNREDLIWIIKRVLQMTAFHQQEYYLNKALGELSYEKEKNRLDDAEAVAGQADAKFAEYIKLLEPYKNRPIMEVPMEVLEKAKVLLEEHERLERRWMQMMDIREG